MERTQTKQNSPARLREILDVLKKHNIVHGVGPEKLRYILQDLGPTFVKLGQIMSMRSDILPKSYCNELVKLRTEASPMSFEEITRILEMEYGTDPKELFASIDAEPLGSASIAQVHRAKLPNNAKADIVLKIQRPDIYETMREDISLMRKAAKLLKHFGGTGEAIDFQIVIEEMWAVTQQEMDFLLEARNIKEFYELNKTIKYVDCPKVNDHLTTTHILVMSYMDGIPIDHVDELTQQGYDMNEIGLKLANNYLKQIFEDGFFHADPHPGNIRIADGKIVWLDLGMMGRLSHHDRTLFQKAITAMAQQDIYELKNLILSIGDITGPIDHSKLYDDIDIMVSKYLDMDFGNINLGKLLEELIDLAKANNIAMPGGVTMLARGAVTLEGVLSDCCPEISTVEILKNHATQEFFKDFEATQEFHRLGQTLYTAAQKSADLPSLLSDLIKITVKGQTRINLKLTDADEPMGKLDKMCGHLVVALLIGALVIGAGPLCIAGTPPLVGSVPLIALIGYMLAVVLTIWLFYHMRKRK